MAAHDNKCDNCGKPFGKQFFDWQGWTGDYCSLQCAVNACPAAKIRVFPFIKNKEEIKKEENKPLRCQEHGLYLYSQGIMMSGEIAYTCKLGCFELHKDEDDKNATSKP